MNIFLNTKQIVFLFKRVNLYKSKSIYYAVISKYHKVLIALTKGFGIHNDKSITLINNLKIIQINFV